MSTDRQLTRATIALVTTLWSPVALAQQPSVPVHPLGRIAAKTTEPLKAVNGIHQLSDGRVMVADGRGRRVLLFDSTLTTFVVAIDSGGTAVRNYGPQSPAALLPYVADTTVFFDLASAALVVIDPHGGIVRTMSVPVPADAAFLTGMVQGSGVPRFDPQGRLIYRGTRLAAGRPTLMGNGSVRFSGPFDTDSAPIVRASVKAAAPDTLGYVRLARTPPGIRATTSRGTPYQTSVTNPIKVVDDWVVTADGSVAFIRGQDYHIDWVGADGTRASSGKLPFLWHQLTDSEKVAIVDSVRAYNVAHAGRMTLGSRDGGPPDTVTVVSAVVDPDSLPNYQAPFAPNSSLADAEGNVWLHPTPTVPLAPGPGAVYDVINRKGQLIDRVQMPPGFTVAGFGRGVVFLTSRDASGLTLVRAPIR